VLEGGLGAGSALEGGLGASGARRARVSLTGGLHPDAMSAPPDYDCDNVVIPVLWHDVHMGGTAQRIVRLDAGPPGLWPEHSYYNRDFAYRIYVGNFNAPGRFEDSPYADPENWRYWRMGLYPIGQAPPYPLSRSMLETEWSTARTNPANAMGAHERTNVQRGQRAEGAVFSCTCEQSRACARRQPFYATRPLVKLLHDHPPRTLVDAVECLRRLETEVPRLKLLVAALQSIWSPEAAALLSQVFCGDIRESSRGRRGM
jgi:hypothetical protein